MKKILFLVMTVAAFATGCKPDNGNGTEPTYVNGKLTFEDNDGGDYWSRLVDSPQNGGELLYGGKPYSWHDSGSHLSSHLTDTQSNMFWSGGIAVTNYFSKDLVLHGDTDCQLTVYADAAHSGRNCAVCYGNISSYGDWRGMLEFEGAFSGIIESMWICPTTYSMNTAVNGDEFSPAVTGNDFVKIVATGYDKLDNEISSAEFMLYDGENRVEEWTEWLLAELGEVKRVRFSMVGRDGVDLFAQPTYFAFDDVEVTIIMRNF